MAVQGKEWTNMARGRWKQEVTLGLQGPGLTGLPGRSRDAGRLWEAFLGGLEVGARDVCRFPSVDIAETEEALLITAELPGVKPEDIQVTVLDGILTLRGEGQPDPGEEGQIVLRRERRIGPFVRHILLRASVDPAGVTATYQNGLLRIRAPKRGEAKPRRITLGAN